MLNELPHRRILRYRFEDHYAYLYFQIFSISHNPYKTWTRKGKNEVIQHIKEEVKFDWDEVEIELERNGVVNKSEAIKSLWAVPVKEFEESYRENRTLNEKIKEILCGF
jgi:hypothetical protein